MTPVKAELGVLVSLGGWGAAKGEITRRPLLLVPPLTVLIDGGDATSSSDPFLSTLKTILSEKFDF
jgi:hypothetical protein